MRRVFPFFQDQVILADRCLLQQPSRLERERQFLFDLFSEQIGGPFLDIIGNIACQFGPLVDVPTVLHIIVVIRLRDHGVEYGYRCGVGTCTGISFHLFDQFGECIDVFFQLIFHPADKRLDQCRSVFRLDGFYDSLFVGGYLICFHVEDRGYYSAYDQG